MYSTTPSPMALTMLSISAAAMSRLRILFMYTLLLLFIGCRRRIVPQCFTVYTVLYYIFLRN